MELDPIRLCFSRWSQNCPRPSVLLMLEILSLPTYIYLWYSLPICSRYKFPFSFRSCSTSPVFPTTLVTTSFHFAGSGKVHTKCSLEGNDDSCCLCLHLSPSTFIFPEDALEGLLFSLERPSVEYFPILLCRGHYCSSAWVHHLDHED